MKKNEKGQATLEFAISLVLFMTFFMFFLKLCLFFVFSSYAQYAVFMSARAYLSSSKTHQDQIDRAKEVILQTVKRGGADLVPSIARGTQDGGSGVVQNFGADLAGLEIGVDPRYTGTDQTTGLAGEVWSEGVRYHFVGKIFPIPLVLGDDSAPSELKLTSEAWLMRDPSDEELCRADQIPQESKQVRTAYVQIHYDNGECAP